MLGFGVAVGVGAGDSETGCFGEQARQTTSTAAIKRSEGMRLLTEGRRGERRVNERGAGGARGIGGALGRKREGIAGFLLSCDGSDQSPRPRAPCGGVPPRR